LPQNDAKGQEQTNGSAAKYSPIGQGGVGFHQHGDARAVVFRSDVGDRETASLTWNQTDAEAFLEKSDATAKPRWITPSVCMPLFVMNTAR
jgi:hypothetical protein